MNTESINKQEGRLTTDPRPKAEAVPVEEGQVKCYGIAISEVRSDAHYDDAIKVIKKLTGRTLDFSRDFVETLPHNLTSVNGSHLVVRHDNLEELCARLRGLFRFKEVEFSGMPVGAVSIDGLLKKTRDKARMDRIVTAVSKSSKTDRNEKFCVFAISSVKGDASYMDTLKTIKELTGRTLRQARKYVETLPHNLTVATGELVALSTQNKSLEGLLALMRRLFVYETHVRDSFPSGALLVRKLKPWLLDKVIKIGEIDELKERLDAVKGGRISSAKTAAKVAAMLDEELEVAARIDAANAKNAKVRAQGKKTLSEKLEELANKEGTGPHVTVVDLDDLKGSAVHAGISKALDELLNSVRPNQPFIDTVLKEGPYGDSQGVNAAKQETVEEAVRRLQLQVESIVQGAIKSTALTYRLEGIVQKLIQASPGSTSPVVIPLRSAVQVKNFPFKGRAIKDKVCGNTRWVLLHNGLTANWFAERDIVVIPESEIHDGWRQGD